MSELKGKKLDWSCQTHALIDKAELARLRLCEEVLREVEWGHEYRETWACCPICHGFQSEQCPYAKESNGHIGHYPNCKLASALKKEPN